MFFAQLTNELWKLFGKKRTYIGLRGVRAGAGCNAVDLQIFTHWQRNFERMLEGNGYLASEYISALTVALIMLFPQAVLLMPLYALPLWEAALSRKEAEDGYVADDFIAADFTRAAAGCEVGGWNYFCSRSGAGIGSDCAGYRAGAFSVGRDVRLRASAVGLDVRLVFTPPPGEGIEAILVFTGVDGDESNYDAVGCFHVFKFKQEAGGGFTILALSPFCS